VDDRSGLNTRELQRYLRRVGDRWPIEHAVVGGAPVGAGDNSDYVVVLVSQRFDGVPWLERVRTAGSLWDAAEMGGRAEVHCYTPVEFERKRAALPDVRDAADRGVDLLSA
jgi:hypothetical protein